MFEGENGLNLPLAEISNVKPLFRGRLLISAERLCLAYFVMHVAQFPGPAHDAALWAWAQLLRIACPPHLPLGLQDSGGRGYSALGCHVMNTTAPALKCNRNCRGTLLGNTGLGVEKPHA
jgi:hypothetical protein